MHPAENLVQAKTNHLSLFGLGGLEEIIPGGGGGGSGGGSGGGGGGGCLIATACFNTSLAKEVETLQKFRDRYLLKNNLGRVIVEFYNQHSPKLANYLKDKESLKRIIRFTLRPLIWLSRTLEQR